MTLLKNREGKVNQRSSAPLAELLPNERHFGAYRALLHFFGRGGGIIAW